MEVLSQHLQGEYQPLDRSELRLKYPRDAVISPHLRRVCRGAAELAGVPILLVGESGTGKGVLAKEIAHQRREREGDIPFVSVNCAALNNEVADSMLFGHRRGAFTGAHERAIGVVGEANGGTLFLDEIHCLSIRSQHKLLRLLDEGAYTVVGESRERYTKFQLVTASNRDLGQLAVQGELLFDLLMRIRGVEVCLPPLRERREEIPDLIALYFSSHRLTIRHEDFNALVSICMPLYWPGNIRQLYRALDAMRFEALIRNEAEYAPHFVVTSAMREPMLAAQIAGPEPAPAEHILLRSAANTDADAAVRIDEIIRAIRAISERPVDAAQLLEALESALIQYAMERCDSIKDVMAHLRMSRGQLDFKRRKYNLIERWTNRATASGQAEGL